MGWAMPILWHPHVDGLSPLSQSLKSFRCKLDTLVVLIQLSPSLLAVLPPLIIPVGLSSGRISPPAPCLDCTPEMEPFAFCQIHGCDSCLCTQLLIQGGAV